MSVECSLCGTDARHGCDCREGYPVGILATANILTGTSVPAPTPEVVYEQSEEVEPWPGKVYEGTSMHLTSLSGAGTPVGEHRMSMIDALNVERDEDGNPIFDRSQYETTPVQPPRCPECVAGKHDNCNGETWDDAQDAPTTCPCMAAGHV